MADNKLSQLTAASSAAASDLLYLVQSSTSKRITVSNLFSSAAFSNATINTGSITNVSISNATLSNATLSNASITLANVAAPATAANTGTIGTVVFDSNYVYVCVATNTWKRANLNSW
jgi:uncharacterized protein YjbI with pentapeptide repeats